MAASATLVDVSQEHAGPKKERWYIQAGSGNTVSVNTRLKVIEGVNSLMIDVADAAADHIAIRGTHNGGSNCSRISLGSASNSTASVTLSWVISGTQCYLVELYGY